MSLLAWPIIIKYESTTVPSRPRWRNNNDLKKCQIWHKNSVDCFRDNISNEVCREPYGICRREKEICVCCVCQRWILFYEQSRDFTFSTFQVITEESDGLIFSHIHVSRLGHHGNSVYVCGTGRIRGVCVCVENEGRH